MACPYLHLKRAEHERPKSFAKSPGFSTIFHFRHRAAYREIQDLRAARVPDEATVFALVANKAKPSEDMVLAYLVDLDDQEDRP
jgi:hypothetical protein